MLTRLDLYVSVYCLMFMFQAVPEPDEGDTPICSEVY